MGAPGGGLKQCAQGRGQDRTSVGSPHMPKATFPFVTARQWVDGWRLFFLIQRLCQRPTQTRAKRIMHGRMAAAGGWQGGQR